MERHMDNEQKTGAGRAVEQTSKDIDRKHENENTAPGAGPEITRHIAREHPETSRAEDEEDDAPDEDDDAADEDDEDEDLDEDEDPEDEDEDADRGTPGYGDRGTTPV
jgi:hypothetical protein